jgi:hypothetical protein
MPAPSKVRFHAQRSQIATVDLHGRSSPDDGSVAVGRRYFADCTITGDDGVKASLGGPWRDFARMVFLRTEMAAVIRTEGWPDGEKPQADGWNPAAE